MVATSVGAEAEHVDEQQRRTLVARQVLKGGNEGELHGFPLFVAGMRSGRPIGQIRIRVGAQPGDIGQRGAVDHGAVAGRAEIQRQSPPVTGRDEIQTGPSGHRVQPRAQRAAPLKARQAPPDP